MAEFLIRNQADILQYIIPIFDKYPLLTSKYYNYDLFKQAALIMTDNTLSTTAKHELLKSLKVKAENRPLDYVSPA